MSTKTQIEDLLEKQEETLENLGKQLLKAERTQEGIKAFFLSAVPSLIDLPKARAAKAIRQWVDSLSGNDEHCLEAQTTLCMSAIEWATEQKRSFLKHRVEVRLIWFYLESRQCTKALDLLAEVICEVKKLDEKLLLVEAFLLQARVYFEVQSITKAKAALTACRTNANAVHVSPGLQAEIEFTAGVLAAAEGDFRVAHSYFLESFDSLIHCKIQNTVGMTTRERAVAFLLVTKLLDNRVREFWSLLQGKNLLPFNQSKLVMALMDIARALEKESLGGYNEAITTHPVLMTDTILKVHIEKLQSDMLEQCIISTLEAYRRLDIGYVAKVLKLPLELVQTKITELILDERLLASVDEGSQIISVLDKPTDLGHLEDAVTILRNLSGCTDVLHVLAQKLC